MSVKSLFIIVATISLAWALCSGSLGIYFEKSDSIGGSKILKFDKHSRIAITGRRYFHNISVATGKTLDAAFIGLGGREWIRQCKDQPVFFGSMLIFLGVSACGVFFIIHMIRTDSRFS